MATKAKDAAGTRNELAALLAGADEDARCKALAADWLEERGHTGRLVRLKTMDAAEEVLRLAGCGARHPTGEVWGVFAWRYYFTAEDVVWILRRRQTGEWFEDGIDLAAGRP